MGHEYVEMKNSHAAIEAYRRAVGMHPRLFSPCPTLNLTGISLDVNRKDYRAWYGLGQAYELMSMHNYALHYYQRATALKSACPCSDSFHSSIFLSGPMTSVCGKHRRCVTKRLEGE